MQRNYWPKLLKNQILKNLVLSLLYIIYMKKLLQSLGPGLLFAGAAIGVSHLVQSTRAGADFGFG